MANIILFDEFGDIGPNITVIRHNRRYTKVETEAALAAIMVVIAGVLGALSVAGV